MLIKLNISFLNGSFTRTHHGYCSFRKQQGALESAQPVQLGRFPF